MDGITLYNISKDLDTKYPLLKDVIQNKKYHYQQLNIKKKNGKIRKLYSPSKVMKYYQRWIATEILSKATVHGCCTSYQKGIGLKANLVPHQNQTYVICMDIEDFFSSIMYERVYLLFKKMISDNKKAKVYAELCTLNNSLPQGAVTSPSLSNIVNYRLDKRIDGYAKKHGLVYTRYADDITLSGNDINALMRAFHVLKYIIRSEGYTLNENKTRLMKPGIRRKVTGLIINESQEIRIGRKKYRELRSMVYNYKNNRAITSKEKEQLFLKIIGWISYLRMVDEKTFVLLIQYINRLYRDRYRNPFETVTDPCFDETK